MTKDSRKLKGNKSGTPLKTGRPTKYNPDYCEQLIEHMSKGFSFESFGGLISVNIDTLYEWVKVHSSFSEAKKLGTAKSMLKFEALGIANLNNKNFNNTIWIYQMKCRFNKFGWNPVSADPYDAGDDFEFK